MRHQSLLPNGLQEKAQLPLHRFWMQSSQATKDHALDLLPKRIPVRNSTTTIIQTSSQCFGPPHVPHSHEYTERLSLYTMPEKLTIKSFLCPCLSIIDDATAVPASQHTHHQQHDKTDGCNARYGRDRAHQNILIMKAISSEQLICWNSGNS